MDSLTEQVLEKYPNFIARRYQRLLDAESPKARVEAVLHVYEVVMRTLALSLISQYLTRDKETLSFDPFSELLVESLSYSTFGTWTEIFFIAMEAYKGRSELLFMPEWHDLYWQMGLEGYEVKPEVRAPFDKLVQIWADQRPQSPAYPESKTEWENLANEAAGALEAFLVKFRFIESYAIIRIERKDEDGYQYKNYTGVIPKLSSTKLVRDQVLKVGWYYLHNLNTGELLHLHPLLVWLSDPTRPVEPEVEMTGFFDHLDKEISYYWEPNLLKLVPHPEMMEVVLDWVYFAIQRYKAYQREISRLDWDILQEICQAISQNTMGESQVKYRRELYLQREDVVRAFNGFLSSDKTCLVLTGKSGVGKTNFVLSLLDEHQGRGEELCFLVYNGAFLSGEGEVKEEISEQFNKRLKFRSREEQAKVEDFLLEINRIPGMRKRKFVLIVDAINENTQAPKLLKRIDQMVREAEVNWLKVVITSRPEAWRRIYRQAKPLVENRYYRMDGNQELGIEMPEFEMVGTVDPASDLAYQVSRFGKDEVKAAFEKYQKAFDLKSNYDDLRPAVRKELRDPLIMRLVSEMYRGGTVPDAIRINNIYRNYVKALIKTGRLKESDEEFLQEEIVPLMAEEVYSNKVSSSQISQHGLRPQVLGREVDSSGRATNKAFQNLVDADILTRHDSLFEYVIRFTFERFYDYYFGQYLYQQVENEQAPEPRYLEWVEKIKGTPYLWGAVKQALLAHLQKLPPETAQQLLRSMAIGASQPVKELLVTTLADYHRDEPEIVTGWIAGFFGADPLDQDEISMPQRVAIEVADQTENTELLEEAAKVKSEPIRAVAVQHIYYVWRRDSKVGFNVLDKLSRGIKGRWGLPRGEVLQSCLALSLTILFNHYKEPDAGPTLQKMWRRILNDVFFINPNKFGTWQESAKARFRGFLLRSIVQFIIMNLAQLPKEGTIGAADLHHFWIGPNREKRFDVFKKLVEVLDFETYSVQDMHKALMKAVDNYDLLCTYVTLILMVTSLCERKKETMPVVYEFFKAGQEVRPVPPSFGYTPWVLAVIMGRQEKVDPDFWQMFLDMGAIVMDTSQGIWYSVKSNFRFMYLHSHDGLYERIYGHELPSPRVREILDEKIKNRDYDLLTDYIDRELTYSGNVRLIIPALKYILNYKIENKKVNDSIARILRRGRDYYPEVVEEFILDTDLAPEIRIQIQTQGTTEKLHDLWSYQALTFFEDIFLLSGDSNHRRMFYWVLGKATDCNSLSKWATLMFKAISNFLYGGPVFPEVPHEWHYPE